MRICSDVAVMGLPRFSRPRHNEPSPPGSPFREQLACGAASRRDRWLLCRRDFGRVGIPIRGQAVSTDRYIPQMPACVGWTKLPSGATPRPPTCGHSACAVMGWRKHGSVCPYGPQKADPELCRDEQTAHPCTRLKHAALFFADYGRQAANEVGATRSSVPRGRHPSRAER